MISSASFSLHRPHLTSSHSQPSSSSSSSILQQATTSLSFTSSIPPAPLLLFPLYTLLIKSLQFVFLSLLCASPLLIPLKDVNRSNVRENTMVILMIWLLTHQMWAFRIIMPAMAVGPPPIPPSILRIHSFCKLPQWTLDFYKLWPCPILSSFFVLFVIIIPCLCDAYPLPFATFLVGGVLGIPINLVFTKMLYPRNMRTAEVTKRLTQVARSLTAPILYTLAGFAFLCGFYSTEALPQLGLIFALNVVSFAVRVLLRRILRKLEVMQFEGPMLFYLFTLSQLFALQSLPKATKFYVVIGSLLMKAMSGIYPLIEWKKLFMNKVDVLPSDDELARRRSALSLFLFPIEEKEVERDALEAFVVMLSTVSSCVLFTPLYLFLYSGYNSKYFVYNFDDKPQLIAFLIYLALAIAVAVATFIFSNSFFSYKYGVYAFRIGVEDFVKYFEAYFSIFIFAFMIFVMFNLRHSNIVYFVAKDLYGV